MRLSEDELIDELVRFYYRYDQFDDRKLSPQEVSRTIRYLLRAGRIVTCEDRGRVLGYIETWRINFEQFGRLLCQIPFHVGEENICDGNILYLANTTILPEFRGWKSGVLKEMRNRVFEQNKDCDYFVGEATRKKAGMVKVFKRSEICLKIGGR